MHHQQPSNRHKRLEKAFSLIEMLVVIAVIGIIAAMALPGVSNVNESAKMARDQRNAQSIATMFNNAKVANCAFASTTKEDILEELIVGKTSPTNGIDFEFSPLNPDEKTATLEYCEYDADQEIMKYNPEGQRLCLPRPPSSSRWRWVEVGVYRNNLVAGIVNQLQPITQTTRSTSPTPTTVTP